MLDFRLVTATIATCLVGCGGTSDQLDCNALAGRDPVVNVATNFDGLWRNSVVDALDEWTFATCGAFSYHVPQPGEELGITIERRPLHEVREMTKTTYAIACASMGIPSVLTVSSEIDPDSTRFRNIVVHEMGHSLGLKFDGNAHYAGDERSVMTSVVSVGGGTVEIGKPELRAFCDRYFPGDEACRVK